MIIKKERLQKLFNNALDWIYEHTIFEGEDEYLSVCKNHLGMNEEELEQVKNEIQ